MLTREQVRSFGDEEPNGYKYITGSIGNKLSIERNNPARYGAERGTYWIKKNSSGFGTFTEEEMFDLFMGFLAVRQEYENNDS